MIIAGVCGATCVVSEHSNDCDEAPNPVFCCDSCLAKCIVAQLARMTAALPGFTCMSMCHVTSTE